MKICSKLYCVGLASLLSVSCSNDDGGSGSGDKNPGTSMKVFDAKGFKNTKSKDQAIRKTSEASSIFKSISPRNARKSRHVGFMPTRLGFVAASDDIGFGDEEKLSCAEAEQELRDEGSFLPQLVRCMLESEDEVGIYYEYVIYVLEEETRPMNMVSDDRYILNEFGEFVLESGDDGAGEDDGFDVIDDIDNEDSFDDDFGSLEPGESVETGVNPMGYMNGFDLSLDSCSDAYRQFENTYASAESQLKQLVKMIKNPDQLNLAQADQVNEDPKLKEVKADDQSAVKYEFDEVSVNGLDLRGYISLGADDSKILVRQDMDMKMDFKKMFESAFEGENDGMFNPEQPGMDFVMTQKVQQTIGADLENRLIEMSANSSVDMVSKEGSLTMKVLASVIVSDKPGDRYVEQTMNFNQAGTDLEGLGAIINLKSTLVSDTEMKTDGTITVNGEVATYSFVVKQGENGRCEVEENFSENAEEVVGSLESADDSSFAGPSFN